MNKWTPTRTISPDALSHHNPIIVSASAGTGKTTTILSMMEHVIKHGTHPRNIMFLTYNANIVREFKDRLKASGLTSQASDLRYMATWHGIGRRLGQAHHVLPPGSPTSMDARDTPGVLKIKPLDLFAKYLKTHDKKYISTILSDIATKTAQNTPLSTRENHIYNSLLAFQKEEKYVSFLSMLRELLTKKLFDDDITHIFVDEAQDFGHGHREYLEHVAQLPSEPKIILVGDEKQEINGYMGAQYEAFTQFPAQRRASLSTTFRLPRSHLNFSNDIFLQSNSTAYVGLTTETEVEHEGVLKELPLLDALHHMREATTNATSVMFLARHRSTLNTVRNILDEHLIPYYDDKVNQAHLAFAKEQQRCIKNNHITPEMLDLLNPLRGSGETGLLNIRKKKDAPYVFHPRREQYRHEQRELSSAQRSILFDFDDQLSSLSKPIELDSPDALHRAGLTPRFAHDLMHNTLDMSFFVGSNDSYQLAKEWVRLYGENVTPIHMHTIHSAKGLEADTVFLCTDTFGKAFATECNEPDIERRVWYVGATRSRNALFLVSLPSQSTSVHRTLCLPRLT